MDKVVSVEVNEQDVAAIGLFAALSGRLFAADDDGVMQLMGMIYENREAITQTVGKFAQVTQDNFAESTVSSAFGGGENG
jgi:hypothetical protein